MNLATLTDTELSEHLNAVLTEQERRAALANIPGQVTELTTRYTAGGGNRQDLTAAVTAAE